MWRQPANRSRARRLAAAVGWLLFTLAALPGTAAQELQVVGQVLYGSAEGARRGGEVDIVSVYGSNPAHMRMRALGLSETDGGHGQRLFAEAQAAANRALAKVARGAGLDVLTVPGGLSGGSEAPPDLTAAVIEQLPLYHVEGRVLAGTARDARVLVELDAAALWCAIPAWREAQLLTPETANYHFLMKQAQDIFERVVKQVQRDGGYDGLVEKGGVTSRLGPVPDVTAAAIAAVGS